MGGHYNMSAKIIRKFVSALMASILVIGSSQMVFAKIGAENIIIYYSGIAVAKDDDRAIITQKEPFVYENMVYVPIRTVAEEFGYRVTWDDNASTIYLDKDDVIQLKERKITKDSFYGLEYEMPEKCEEIEAELFYWRLMWLEDEVIVISFQPDKEDISSDDFFNELISENFSNNPIEEGLFDLSFVEDLVFDDNLSEEYIVLWEQYRCIEKKIKTQAGTISIYLESYGEHTKDEQLKKFDEFMSKTVFRTGQENIQVMYKDIKIMVKDKEISVEREPFIYNGTMYMAVRDLAKTLNKEVEWNDGYNVVKISNKPGVGGVIFATTDECDFVMDGHGDLMYYFENGRGFVAYYEGVDFEDLKGKESKKELEEEKQKEFDGININLTNYKFMEINGREYLILDYEGYTVMEGVLTEMPRAIIMRVNGGVIMANYIAYMGDNTKDLELFETLMFTAIEE